MNQDFEKGYRKGRHAGEILGDKMSEEELLRQLELVMDLGMIENVGYWTGRLAIYGTDPTLDDGTMLSY